MLRGYGAATITIGTLGGREHALTKTRRAQEHFANPSDFDNVYADGDNHKR